MVANSKTIKLQQGVITYKSMNNLTPQYITHLLKPVAETLNRTLRSSVNGALAVPRSRSSLFDRSYSYTTTKLWNSIPIPIRNTSPQTSFKIRIKVSNGAKIRNPYNQVPHLTQDTNGKVTNSQLDTTNESQEVSIFSAGDHKEAHINSRVQRHSKTRQKEHKRSKKEVPPWNASIL